MIRHTVQFSLILFYTFIPDFSNKSLDLVSQLSYNIITERDKEPIIKEEHIMKKINNKYALSATEKKRIAAHTRALARKASYDGQIEAWFDTETGSIRYNELVGSSYTVAAPQMELIASEDCHSFKF